MTTTPTVWKDLSQVNTTDEPEPFAHVDTTNEQSFSKVVALADGGYLIAWEDWSGKHAAGLEPRDVVGQIYDAFGNPIGGEIALSSVYLDYDQKAPDIVALSDGGFIVAYQTTGDPAFGDGENIAVQVYDAAGNHVRTEDFRQGFGGPLLDDARPTITVFADGSYLLVYEEVTAGSIELVGYHVDASGTKGAKFDVVPGAAGGGERAPEAALLSNGNYVIAYARDTPPAGEIAFLIGDPSGAAAPIAGTIATGSAESGAAIGIAALTGGGFVVVWEDRDADGVGNAGVKARIYSNSGVALGAAFAVPTTTAGEQTAPAITALDDGGFMVVWEDDNASAVLGQRFSATGEKIGSEFVAAHISATYQPSVAVLSDGRVVVSVTNDVTGNFDVHAVILDPRSQVTGTEQSDILTSRRDGATVLGLGGDDFLYGYEGNDVLNGGTGNDYMAGGAGDDIYIVAAAGDQTIELPGGGIDTVRAYISWTLADNVERLELVGTGNLNGTGNTLNNTLVGNAGNNVLNGGAGDDYMVGGAGDDIYIVGAVGDRTIEQAGGGTDTVRAYISWTLADNVERLELQGTGNLNGTGNALNNTLVGNAANNVLNGGAGNDYMVGGAGNDIYIVDAAGDRTIELVGGGTDTVRAFISWTLADNVERLELQGTGNLNGTGNALNNTLVGNAGNNVLNGGAGDDYMVGGAGDDIYIVAAVGDRTIEQAGGGIDTVRSYINWTLANNVERLELMGTGNLNGTGNALDNTLVGNAGNNVLTGGSGRDTLTGGAGADRFVYTAVSDTGIDAATRDIITDFTPGVDKIDFSAIDANEIAAGNNAFTFLAESGAAFTGAGQIRWFQSDGQTFVVGNTDADLDPEFMIQIVGLKTLTESDFIL